VLRDVSFRIPSGQAVAVVGESGAGKSSLVRLLTGFYPPSAGRIRVDGIPLGERNRNAYRRSLGVVLQDNHLFEGTVRHNVVFGRTGATADQVADALARAGVDLSPDHPVADRGVNLSEGQQQRLALARAFLSRPAILLLDEATAALDGRSDRLLRAPSEAWGCTSVMVAHRLTVAAVADRILVLENGRLVEDGDHQTLLARNGVYTRLWNAHEEGKTMSTSTALLADGAR
jgi:ATP-binding cassette subfamily B protein